MTWKCEKHSGQFIDPAVQSRADSIYLYYRQLNHFEVAMGITRNQSFPVSIRHERFPDETVKTPIVLSVPKVANEKQPKVSTCDITVKQSLKSTNHKKLPTEKKGLPSTALSVPVKDDKE